MWAVVIGVATTVTVALWWAIPAELRTVEDVQMYARADRYDLLLQMGFAIAGVLAVLIVRRLIARQHLAFVQRDLAGQVDVATPERA